MAAHRPCYCLSLLHALSWQAPPWAVAASKTWSTLNPGYDVNVLDSEQDALCTVCQCLARI